MKKYFFSILFVLALVSVGILAQDMMSETMSETMQVTTTHVETHPSQGDVQIIEGASATLVSSEHGFFGTMETTGLEDGHVYTLWVAIVNNPEACESTPCSGGDVIGNTDELQANLTWGDGMVYDSETGRMVFNVHVAVGDLPEPWFEYSLVDPMSAEIHFVINDHGEVIPDMAANMLNTYRGGCTDESLPPPFPDTAKSDGEAGPNQCRLIQAAIFSQ